MSDTETYQEATNDGKPSSGQTSSGLGSSHTGTGPDLFRVGVRIPPFWPEKPGIWFAQIEGQFALSRITDDSTKFYYVISQLNYQYAAEVEDVITNPPKANRYEKLKSELIKRLSVSRENKVKQLLMHEELGDRKPSQFLRHLQNLAGPQIPEDFLRTIWASRLPGSMQAIIASQATQQLDTLADLADRIHNIVPPSPQVAAASTSRASPSQESPLEAMAKQIAELTKQVSALSAQVSSRSRSQTRHDSHSRRRSPSTRSHSSYRKFPVCWYHSKFGSQAKKCVRPCDYKSTAGNAQGSL